MKTPFKLTLALTALALTLSPALLTAQERTATSAGATTAPGTEARKRAANRPAPGSPEATRRRATLFNRLDANSDGTLTREEFNQMGNRQRTAGQPPKNARKSRRNTPAVTTPAPAPTSSQTTTTTTTTTAESEKTIPAKPQDPRPTAEIKKERIEPNSAEKRVLDHTRTTGATGGTGSSASGPTADGTTQTGTTEQKP